MLAARKAARVTRSEIAHECQVLPRTVARWEDGESDPGLLKRGKVVKALYATGRTPRHLLEALAEQASVTLWQLGLELPPGTKPVAPVSAYVESAAAQKVVDDAVRAAAEDLAIDPRALRPVASRLFEAIAQGEIPAEAAAKMALGRASSK
jgi:transcriptional regulator with XRE-family HTH domain